MNEQKNIVGQATNNGITIKHDSSLIPVLQNYILLIHIQPHCPSGGFIQVKCKVVTVRHRNV